MKQLIDFLNESKGQRISLRRENKPYNPNDDILVKNKDNRKDRADKLRNDRKFDKISKNLEKFKQALKNISRDEILSDGYINLYLEYLYNNKEYYDIHCEDKDIKYFNILKIDDIDKLNCWRSRYSSSPDIYLRYDRDDLSYKGCYIKIEDEDFFDKHLFVYIGYHSGNQSFSSALSKYINKGLKYDGRIKASTLMDNPDLFMKAYEKIKERF